MSKGGDVDSERSREESEKVEAEASQSERLSSWEEEEEAWWEEGQGKAAGERWQALLVVLLGCWLVGGGGTQVRSLSASKEVD